MDVSQVLAPLTRHLPYNKNGGKISFGDATVHELKTLLTAIVVSAELLSEELQSSHNLMPQRLARNIIRNAHNLDEKLANFPEMAGLLSGEPPFEPELLEIGPVIHDISSQVYTIIHSRKQSLNVHLPSALPQVTAQRHHLEHILLNLITNASKFTPEFGNITVSASRNGSSLIIEVSDNGIGIPVDKQEMVFEPYYQAAGGQGSGLGLAITKFLVELHGGTIWLESISGKGSRFFFSLPLSSRRELSGVHE